MEARRVTMLRHFGKQSDLYPFVHFEVLGQQVPCYLAKDTEKVLRMSTVQEVAVIDKLGQN